MVLMVMVMVMMIMVVCWNDGIRMMVYNFIPMNILAWASPLKSLPVIPEALPLVSSIARPLQYLVSSIARHLVSSIARRSQPDSMQTSWLSMIIMMWSMLRLLLLQRIPSSPTAQNGSWSRMQRGLPLIVKMKSASQHMQICKNDISNYYVMVFEVCLRHLALV